MQSSSAPLKFSMTLQAQVQLLISVLYCKQLRATSMHALTGQQHGVGSGQPIYRFIYPPSFTQTYSAMPNQNQSHSTGSQRFRIHAGSHKSWRRRILPTTIGSPMQSDCIEKLRCTRKTFAQTAANLLRRLWNEHISVSCRIKIMRDYEGMKIIQSFRSHPITSRHIPSN